jgi:hypothetical protein
MVRDEVPKYVTSQTVTKGFQRNQRVTEELRNGAICAEMNIDDNIVYLN